jgi:hypothetical protein
VSGSSWPNRLGHRGGGVRKEVTLVTLPRSAKTRVIISLRTLKDGTGRIDFREHVQRPDGHWIPTSRGTWIAFDQREILKVASCRALAILGARRRKAGQPDAPERKARVENGGVGTYVGV